MKTESSYLLLGPENGEKARFIQSVKEEVKQKAGGNLEEHRFYPFEIDVQTIVGILKNGSLFSDWKTVTIYQVETITKKDEIEALIECCKNPAENTVLFLVSDEIQVDKRLKSKFPKSGTKIFWEMFENKKHDWIKSFFRRDGKSIDPEAVDLILELVSNNTLDLKRECGRLLFFYDEKETITVEDIESFLYHSKEENVFSLFDKIAKKDLEGSVEIGDKLFLSGDQHPVQLFGGLIWQFKKLHLLLIYTREEHFSQDEAFKKCAVFSKRARSSYIEAMKKYSVAAVENILSLLAEYDLLVRESKTEWEKLLFSLFIYSCVKKEGKSCMSVSVEGK